MSSLSFSNGVSIDSLQILSIESNQQMIKFPGEIGEVKRLLDGQPSNLVIHMRDESTVEIKADTKKLGIELRG